MTEQQRPGVEYTSKETRTCDDCGLIWWGEMINLVAHTGDDVLGNHCPNCGSTEVVRGIHD